MSFAIVLGIARAEARLLRRLVRYWVFVLLSWLGGFAIYLWYSFIHGLASSYSASVGSINPTYLVSAFGFNYLAVLLIGVIFMSFDVRSRDERERVSEVLDSRPFSNLELVLGRFLGILFQVWWPLLVFMLFVQGFGALAGALKWPLGDVVEWRSFLAFAGPVAIPCFALVLALTFLVSLGTRHRLVTTIVLFALIIGWGWFFFTASVDMIQAADFIGTSAISIPSEMVSAVWSPFGLLQRLAILAAAAGILAFAAVLHPRLDDARRLGWAVSGAVLLLFAVGSLGWIVRDAYASRDRFDGWKTAHEARKDEPVPDVRTVNAKVKIDPGEELNGEVQLEFAAPDGGLKRALFTLNPGLKVTKVSGAGNVFTHEQGLLDVTLDPPLAAGETASLTIAFWGLPDRYFAYLDAALNAPRMPYFEAGNFLFFGGYEPAYFDRGVVVLTPGIYWLPTSGTGVGHDERPPDFYELTLDVEAPEGWLVAGPGRREEAGDGFRFVPGAPLSEVAVVASRFESVSIEVEGVTLEMLLHPSHTKNLQVLAPAKDEIRNWLQDRFHESAEIGLDYPYGAFTLVEVPGSLRSYGGGWRMDTALTPPAMVLMREWGFPTARFDTRFRKPETFEDREGGLPRAQRKALEGFFESDFSGSNPFLGAARSFFSHQVATYGPGSLALDFVCYELTSRLTSGKQGYFSANLFGRDEFNAIIQRTMSRLGPQGGPDANISELVRYAAAERPEVWDQVLGVSLVDMDPWKDPAKATNVLVLKAGAMSRWLLDGLGREKAGRLVAALRSRFSGSAFDADDFKAVAEDLGIDLAGLTGDWLGSTELPGFLVSEPRYVRLADDQDGVPRYQLSIHLRNDEDAPGLVRILTVPDDGEDGRDRFRRLGRYWDESDPIRVGPDESVEVGFVFSKPVARMRVEPYLALNREGFDVQLPRLDQEKVVDAEPFTGMRPSDWLPPSSRWIVVDDLDPGFSVESDEVSSGLRLASRFQPPQTFDRGLPLLADFRPPKEWSRRILAGAYGKYRRTQAVIRAGQGKQRAIFAAELPDAGAWKLELYVEPNRRDRRNWKQGTYHLKVIDANGDVQAVSFDASGAEEGWNPLGELELPSGKAQVVLSDETDGGAVIADAIRWREENGGSEDVEEKTDG